METFLTDLAAYLADNSVGTVATDIFIGGLTVEPSNQVVIKPTGGIEPDKDLPIPRPTVQIIVRNTDFSTGEALARSIYNLLHQKDDKLVMGTTDVMQSEALQEPSYFEQDNADLHLFICNYSFMIRP